MQDIFPDSQLRIKGNGRFVFNAGLQVGKNGDRNPANQLEQVINWFFYSFAS
jgi:hypothetical protein